MVCTVRYMHARNLPRLIAKENVKYIIIVMSGHLERKQIKLLVYGNQSERGGDGRTFSPYKLA